jgi:hypothetical protein
MTVQAEEIRKRLDDAPHLQEASVSDLKKEMEEEAGISKEKPHKDDPRDKEEFTFKVNYKDARGKIWDGKFVNRILTIKERRLVGPLQSRLLLGADITTLPASSIELAAIQAHLAYSLKEKPDWAENLDDVNDPNVLYTIYEEVASHEAFFQRGDESQKESAAKSG